MCLKVKLSLSQCWPKKKTGERVSWMHPSVSRQLIVSQINPTTPSATLRWQSIAHVYRLFAPRRVAPLVQITSPKRNAVASFSLTLSLFASCPNLPRKTVPEKLSAEIETRKFSLRWSIYFRGTYSLFALLCYVSCDNVNTLKLSLKQQQTLPYSLASFIYGELNFIILFNLHHYTKFFWRFLEQFTKPYDKKNSFIYKI